MFYPNPIQLFFSALPDECVRATPVHAGAEAVLRPASTASMHLRGSLLRELDQHLGVPIDPLIKFLIRVRCIVDLNAVADDLAGLRPARSQSGRADIRCNSFTGACPLPIVDSLVEEVRDGKRIHAILSRPRPSPPGSGAMYTPINPYGRQSRSRPSRTLSRTCVGLLAIGVRRLSRA